MFPEFPMDKKRDTKQSRAHVAKRVRRALMKIRKEPCYCHPGCDLLTEHQKDVTPGINHPAVVVFGIFNHL